jgi:hypothetical protein
MGVGPGIPALPEEPVELVGEGIPEGRIEDWVLQAESRATAPAMSTDTTKLAEGFIAMFLEKRNGN